ncbi:DUF4406 domain-containing protein [Paraburkholderia bengalensis]|uniref:DUF4406 domain-containing protein n=1 Tax=Paraburkholderia bengalensis TaxID=2747562 RepID=A0ABU8IRJ8_9BURK
MKLYVSGPMTGLPGLNKPAFHVEAARLRAMGFEVENPANVELGPNAVWLDYMRADLKLLMDCDGIVLLPGWEKSRGAAVEHGLARSLGLQVFDSHAIIGRAGDFPVLSLVVFLPAPAEAA